MRFFHWELEFPEVFIDLARADWQENGGFDAVVGNPPYVDVSLDSYWKTNLACSGARNLYAFMLEKSFTVSKRAGRIGQIVPLSLVCSSRMAGLRSWLRDLASEISVANFGIRPAKIFPRVDQRVTIITAQRKRNDDEESIIQSTRYHRWHPGTEMEMIANLRFVDIGDFSNSLGWPKLGDEVGRQIYQKIFKKDKRIENYLSGDWTFYYHGIGRYWLKAYDFLPTYVQPNGQSGRSSTLFDLSAHDEEIGRVFVGIVNSSLFFWYWTLFSDDFHLMKSEIASFPFSYDKGLKLLYQRLGTLVDQLMKDYVDKSVLKRGKYPRGTITWQEFYPRQSKVIIDQIDDLLGSIYGLT
jgi:hypothetical protein